MKINNILKVARPLLTIFEYAVSVLIIAVTAQIVFGSNLQTWIITMISIVLAVSTYAIWYTDGVERGEKTAKVYNTTLRFNTYARKIREMQVQEQEREFCAKKNAEHKLDLTIEKLTEYELSLNDLNKYKELAQKARVEAKIKPRKHIWQKNKVVYPEYYVDFCNQFTKKQQRTLKILAEKEIKFDKVVPKDLTKTTWRVKGIKPKNNETKRLPSNLISKVVWGVALGILTASIAFAKKGAWTINETIQVLSWAFSISFNIYTSIVAGYKSVVVDRFDYFQEKIELTTEFFGYINKPIDEIEKEITEHLKAE